GLEIDNKFVLRRRLHRQVGGLFAPEDAIDIAGRAPQEHADAPHSLGLLRACRERPRRALPRSVMNSRRFMGFPQGQGSQIKYSRSGPCIAVKAGGPMTAVGQSLPINMTATRAQGPLHLQ